MLRIAIASDHAGMRLKDRLRECLTAQGYALEDLGTYAEEAVDYPDFALAVAEEVAAGRFDRGILVCGTGAGMCIAANKVPGVRAALCNDPFTAQASRAHNDANVLTLGARVIGPELACTITRTWLETPFEGGRHARRVAKIGAIESKYSRST